METYTPNELKEKFKDSWVSAYKDVITMTDGNLVELWEYHPCISGSNWIVHQYAKTSKLIKKARRDGNKHIFLLETGKTPLNLKSSVNAAGIEEVKIKEDEVHIVHAGLAGAGVGAARCRGMGKGVKKIIIQEPGGGSKLGKATVVTPKMEKLVIGIDDTDTKETGATWTTAHNVGLKLAEEGFSYLDHIIVQLYPHNPNKTQNCVSIALSFAVLSEEKEKLIKRTVELLKEYTLSEKTAIAILEGIEIPKKLREYSMDTKTRMMTLEETEKVAKELNIRLIEVTGAQGKIGALAALGLYDDYDEAVKVYY